MGGVGWVCKLLLGSEVSDGFGLFWAGVVVEIAEALVSEWD
ncbi:MAG: hypothetical protein ACRD3K_04885 [Edaphobacter sp.]